MAMTHCGRPVPFSAVVFFLGVCVTSGAARADDPSGDPPDDTAVIRAAPVPARNAGDYDLPTGLLGNVPRLSTTDALQTAPGVSITNESNEGDAPEVQLRGFAGDNGQDIAFTVEGIPLNDESNPLTHGYADVLSVMPELLSGLRVTEGVSDPRQGNFALAGSIDLRLGLAQRGVTALGTVGSYGYRRAAVLWGPGDTPNESFVGAEAVHSDGIGSNRTWDRADVLAQHVIALGHRVSLRMLVGLMVSSWQDPGVLRLDDVNAGRVGFYDSYPGLGAQGGSSTRGMVSVALVRDADGARTELRFYGLVRSFREDANPDGFVSDPVHGDLLSQGYLGGTLGVTGTYRKTINLGGLAQELEVGLTLRHDRYAATERHLDGVTDAVLVPPSVGDNSGGMDVTNPGAYVDVTARPFGWLTVRAGGRVDAMVYNVASTVAGATATADTMGVHVGPKATLVLGPWCGFRLLASYGTGFRSPDARTVTDGGPVVFSTATTEDVTLRYSHGDPGTPRWMASVTGFHTTVYGDEVFDPVAGTSVSVGDTDRLGVVAWARARPVSWIDVNASVAYTRSTVEASALNGALAAGAAIPYLPVWVGRVDTAVERGVGVWAGAPVRLRAGMGVSYRGPEALVTLPATEATVLVDASGGMRVGPIGLDLAARNVLDAQWHSADFEYVSNVHAGTPTNTTPARQFVAGAPRMVCATLSLTP